MRLVVTPPPSHLDRTRRTFGLVLYLTAMLVGGGLLLVVFLVPPLFSKDPGVEYGGMFIGGVLAFPAAFAYLWVPWLVDRYDPEPLWCLVNSFFWGAVASCGFAATINTMAGLVGADLGGASFGEAFAACVSAPLVEEFFKGLGVFGLFYFLKREFDGVVDGIIYAAFIAIGFAAMENVLYYGRAATQDMATGASTQLGTTVVLRGILTPWIHPLFTAMTGLGFGIARETKSVGLRWLAPLGGYAFAVFLHATWNTAATLSGMLSIVMLPLWLLFVTAFAVMVLVLVRRKGRIIASHLQDEVLVGFLTLAEYELVTSAFASWHATFSWGGAPARQFVGAVSRLSLLKWHSIRSAEAQTQTISGAFVAPLRQEIKRLRGEMGRALGRALPNPQPWQPTPEHPRPPWVKR